MTPYTLADTVCDTVSDTDADTDAGTGRDADVRNSSASTVALKLAQGAIFLNSALVQDLLAEGRKCITDALTKLGFEQEEGETPLLTQDAESGGTSAPTGGAALPTGYSMSTLGAWRDCTMGLQLRVRVTFAFEAAAMQFGQTSLTVVVTDLDARGQPQVVGSQPLFSTSPFRVGPRFTPDNVADLFEQLRTHVAKEYAKSDRGMRHAIAQIFAGQIADRVSP